MSERNELGGPEPPPTKAPTLVSLSWADGRLEPPNPSSLTPTVARDLDLMADGVVTGTMAEKLAPGVPSEAAALAPRFTHDEANPRTPEESLVLRSMTLAQAQQRYLLALSSKVPGTPMGQRYAELALRAGREVSRAAAALTAIRRPATVTMGPGSKANVVNGDQTIVHEHDKEASRDVTSDP